MSKVLVLTNSIGGLWSFRCELMRKLLDSGFEVPIHCPLGERIKDFEEMGCKVSVAENLNRRGMNPIKDIRLLFEYIKIIKKEKPDVVLTYTIKPNIYGGLACRIMRVPYLSNITGIGTAIAGKGILAKLCIFLYRMGVGGVKTLFFQNSSNEKLFSDRKIARNKHRIIPGSGVNLDKHVFTEYPQSDKIVFLFVGRVMKAKGIEEFLYASEKLSEKYENVEFLICGFCDEKKYIPKIEELSKKYNLNYLGSVLNIDEYYQKSHCVVLPSYHEGTANVLLEGQATGRPVISTDAPGCGETFVENVSGFLCEVGNGESLLKAMEKIINLSYDERKEMGIRGRENVEKNYDRNIVTNAYMEEIEKIIGGKYNEFV